MHENNLRLVPRQRNGGGGRTERNWLDFSIDGRSLHDILEPGDLIGCLGWLSLKQEQQIIQQLLMKAPSELGENTSLIYVCPECGDISCGAIGVTITKTVVHVVWSNFYEVRTPDWLDYDIFAHIQPVYFNKTLYWQTLNQRALEIVGKNGVK